tara:strand:- start:2424 stop:2639 length:216 start_codon:yes stop_codon:yes gene_type:complete
MKFEQGQLVKMIYMEELDPNCEMGIITTSKNDLVIIHWFEKNMSHKLSPDALQEGVDCGVYKVIGLEAGTS